MRKFRKDMDAIIQAEDTGLLTMVDATFGYSLVSKFKHYKSKFKLSLLNYKFEVK